MTPDGPISTVPLFAEAWCHPKACHHQHSWVALAQVAWLLGGLLGPSFGLMMPRHSARAWDQDFTPPGWRLHALYPAPIQVHRDLPFCQVTAVDQVPSILGTCGIRPWSLAQCLGRDSGTGLERADPAGSSPSPLDCSRPVSPSPSAFHFAHIARALVHTTCAVKPCKPKYRYDGAARQPAQLLCCYSPSQPDCVAPPNPAPSPTLLRSLSLSSLFPLLSLPSLPSSPFSYYYFATPIPSTDSITCVCALGEQGRILEYLVARLPPTHSHNVEEKGR